MAPFLILTMPYLIKTLAEDFQVEEIADLPLVAHGAFAVYRLDKSGWNTVDALREISKDLKIPSKLFSYGGRKDRHARTSQYVTIENPKIKDYLKENLRLTFVGFMDRPMGPDLIEGNRFQIIVRKLSAPSVQGLLAETEVIRGEGFVNYFDDQRFGSFDPDQGFLAEKLLLGHFKGAVKILLTSVHSGDPSNEKKRKKFFLEHWKDWKACLSSAHNEFERFAFAELQKGEKGALTVLNHVPKEDLSMYFSAFQSYVWNEVVAAYVKETVGEDGIGVHGVAGEYVFYRDIKKDLWHRLSKQTVPTMAHNTVMPDLALAQIYEHVLKFRGIQKPMFNKLKVRKAFFKTTDRPMIVMPRDLEVRSREDDRYPPHQILGLNFFLPRGSYATMLIKRLMFQAE